MKKARRVFANLFRRKDIEETLEAELRGYVDELTERHVSDGTPPEEARRRALVEAGGVEVIKEQVRDQWLGNAIESTVQDIRYAGRGLRRAPGFAVVVITTLALGIGANLTMFSLMRTVLWRPLPYPEPDRIVTIRVEARHVADAGATPGEVMDLRARSQSFEHVSMFNWAEANIEYQGEMEHVPSASVSDDFLALLGARAALGRTLDSRIDAGNDQVLAVVISDELWRRRFGGDAGVVGKTVRVNNLDVQVVGVLAGGFRLYFGDAEQVDVWFPSRIEPTRQYRGINVAARLKRGVTIEQANTELAALALQFEREHPDFYSGVRGWQASPADSGTGAAVLHFTARGLHDEMTRGVRPALLLLASVVGLVLLIACVNVANLMLARGAARRRELEIRRALGAGRLRIARQLLTESMVLAVAAAALGLLYAYAGLEAIARTSHSHIPMQSRLGMDASAGWFAVLLSVITSLLFGLLPAWRMASGGSAAGQPLGAGRSETAGTGGRRLQRVLVVAEVALSIVPLACGGLMMRSFVKLMEAPLGFDPAHVMTAKAPFSLRRFPGTTEQMALMRGVLDRVRAIPGVEAVSAASPLPLEDQQSRRVGRNDQPEVPPIRATQQFAMPGYLAVMGTKLREGRDFTDDDVVSRRKVTIVDERLARRLWPEASGGSSAIGKVLSVYRTGRRDELEVIGVISAVRVTRVRDEDDPHYMMPDVASTLVIKTQANAQQLTQRIQQAVEGAHTGRAVFDIKPMTDTVSDSIGDTRFLTLVLAVFAGVAVLLAAVGL